MEKSVELKKLNESLERVKLKQSRLLKDKAASPIEIMNKNMACLTEIEQIKAKIAKLEKTI